MLCLGQTFASSEFCEERKMKDFSNDSLNQVDNRLSFRNQGGIANGGVCWWHSRFQRNATYLVTFAPEKVAPTQKEAKKIIDRIRRGRDVVEIPGFYNLFDFSVEYKTEILKELAAWQRTDGFINQAWLLGIKGKTRVEPEKLEKMMNELYFDVKTGNSVFQVLQIKGITAHAWLVIGMQKSGLGYQLSVIDSNFPTETMVYDYKVGDDSFYSPFYGNFVSYTYKSHEEERLQKVVKEYCSDK